MTEQPPYAQPYQQPVYFQQPPPRRNNGLAIASLILGLTGFITCGFTSILAVVFGHVALGQIRRDRTDGHGMALTGVVLGWILTGLWILYWILAFAGIVTGIGGVGSSTAAQPTAGATQLVGEEPAPSDHKVTFEASGKNGAKTATNVTYNVGFDIKQGAGVPLPYSKSVSVDEDAPTLSLWVQNADAEGTITCRIKVDGKMVREAKSNGPYGVCRVETDGLGG
ncbi:hypothetical protein Psi02_15810 [Planotetraspora silvatica]|uniref:DUF4190 domain-containing protein n=1 Tax=Planotetraspora silvatica TaxID=234614 RepID=A0A8J3XKD4_9ACTN|nr:DUF4190 domain-containing protein [Planotetraspora silvatica]GII45157.1 hypothetical protein Psi02_15810 [Planotetraspora silvatica]